MNVENWPKLPRFVWVLWFLAVIAVGVGSGLGMSDGAAFALVMVLSLFAFAFYGLPQSFR